ncbi:MXAN_6230/SCO0854 family RING domain-containing protein [Symbioplanes lichenis]|uniref:MXAN_6230/SCO0854 family RING domain-containing protein n=1 Tax=Symbioplanes lichenis TaxID=1629072 RepID=UPI002739828B|nr:MXAN_6230/SCO0854 family RING domain-containing protein [Actinoplanes lichenis]
MDAVATVLVRRTAQVTLPAHEDQAPGDGPAWVTALEADLALRGRLLGADLRAAAATLPPVVRTAWADWLLATLDAEVGADRDLTPLYRRFPDTPADPSAVYVERLLVHLFAAPDLPCVLCGREHTAAPLDPCGHVVCHDCFPPEEHGGCPICGRRAAAGQGHLPEQAPAVTPLRIQVLTVAGPGAAATVRDELVARPSALGEADLTDLETLVRATAPGTLDWLPEVVPARETLASVIAWALHATALTPDFARVTEQATARWTTATDAARTLWAWSGGDPGLILPARTSGPGPREHWRPAGEPAVAAPVTRVRAIPRALRRAVLTHLDSLGPAAAAEDLQRHPTVWKRLGERLHPHERPAAHPAAAVAFAALRGTRADAGSTLGRTITAAGRAHPGRLVALTAADGTITIRVRTHAALVEEAFTTGDPAAALTLLAQRPGDLWRALDHLLRRAHAEADGDDVADGDVDLSVAVLNAARTAAAHVSPVVLATAAAEIAARDTTVPATAEQLAAVEQARAAAGERAAEAARRRTAAAVHVAHAAAPLSEPVGLLSRALTDLRRRLSPGDVPERTEDRPGAAPATGDASATDPGRPGEDMPRRVFFPRGNAVRSWTEPERRTPLPAAVTRTVREIADAELCRRAGAGDRFDLAVLDAELAAVPAPMRERAGSAQLAGWPRGSVRDLPGDEVLRLFLHWEDAGSTRVDLDLSAVFFDAGWRRLGHCDYTRLRFADTAAVHSGDFTSAPAPLGATEFLDLSLPELERAGVRWAVPTILSYNDVPFELLGEAFAGFSLPSGRERPDAPSRESNPSPTAGPARVVQRFDLRGTSKAQLPMVVDLRDRRLLWADLTLPSHGYAHSVATHGDRLARAAADLWHHFTSGSRPTLLDVAAWHASARADRIVIRHPDGTYTESAPDPAAIRTAAATDRTARSVASPPFAGRRIFAAAVDTVPTGDVGDGSLALLVTGTAPNPWTTLRGGDLLGQLPAAK